MAKALVWPALVSMLLAGDAIAGQSQNRGSCGDTGRGFAENARDRAAVVLLVNVLSAPDPQLSPSKRSVRLEVLDSLKGRSASPLIDVLVDDDGAGLKMRVGERWLVALPGVGTPFIQGGCEVFAVKVEGNDAVGRVLSGPYRESVQMHVVPIDTIRNMLRDPSISLRVDATAN